MSGKTFAARPLSTCVLAALMFLALPGCYPRQSISSTPPGATPERRDPKPVLEIQAEAPKAEAKAAEAVAAQPATQPAAEAPKAEAPKDEAPKAAETAAPAAAAEPAKAEAQAQPAAQDAAKAEAPKGDTVKAEAADSYYVQIGSFATAKNAEGAVGWLKEKGYANARIVLMEQGATTYHRVQAGPYPSYAAARKILEELKEFWPQVFIPGD
jgi:cell division protein FtsN